MKEIYFVEEWKKKRKKLITTPKDKTLFDEELKQHKDLREGQLSRDAKNCLAAINNNDSGLLLSVIKNNDKSLTNLWSFVQASEDYNFIKYKSYSSFHEVAKKGYHPPCSKQIMENLAEGIEVPLKPIQIGNYKTRETTSGDFPIFTNTSTPASSHSSLRTTKNDRFFTDRPNNSFTTNKKKDPNAILLQLEMDLCDLDIDRYSDEFLNEIAPGKIIKFELARLNNDFIKGSSHLEAIDYTIAQMICSTINKNPELVDRFKDNLEFQQLSYHYDQITRASFPASFLDQENAHPLPKIIISDAKRKLDFSRVMEFQTNDNGNNSSKQTKIDTDQTFTQAQQQWGKNGKEEALSTSIHGLKTQVSQAGDHSEEYILEEEFILETELEAALELSLLGKESDDVPN